MLLRRGVDAKNNTVPSALSEGTLDYVRTTFGFSVFWVFSVLVFLPTQPLSHFSVAAHTPTRSPSCVHRIPSQSGHHPAAHARTRAQTTLRDGKETGKRKIPLLSLSLSLSSSSHLLFLEKGKIRKSKHGFE
jgi:hypothetical protein